MVSSRRIWNRSLWYLGSNSETELLSQSRNLKKVLELRPEESDFPQIQSAFYTKISSLLVHSSSLINWSSIEISHTPDVLFCNTRQLLLVTPQVINSFLPIHPTLTTACLCLGTKVAQQFIRPIISPNNFLWHVCQRSLTKTKNNTIYRYWFSANIPQHGN